MKILKYALFGVIGLVLLGLGAFAYLGMQSRSGSALGLVDGRLAACPASPNCVSSETGEPAEKTVEPLPLEVWDALPALLAEMGGTVTGQEVTYLSVEFSSSLFGFVDDVEFRVTETAIHVRSASRVGHSDAGVNQARIADLRARLGA